MKILVLISRILLGLVFVVFGSNGFLHFLPAELPPGLAGQFAGAMLQSHYILVVAAIQVIGGVLLLVNRYVPLALALLGPVIFNILVFHLLLFTQGLVIAAVVAVLWIILFVRYREYFSGLFVQKAS
jgi:putative oxidoreductase